MTVSGYTPGVSVVGTTMFICTRPINPGVRPAKETVAAADPIFAEYGDLRDDQRTVVGASVPSFVAGDTGPEPVR